MWVSIDLVDDRWYELEVSIKITVMHGRLFLQCAWNAFTTTATSCLVYIQDGSKRQPHIARRLGSSQFIVSVADTFAVDWLPGLHSVEKSVFNDGLHVHGIDYESGQAMQARPAFSREGKDRPADGLIAYVDIKGWLLKSMTLKSKHMGGAVVESIIGIEKKAMKRNYVE